MSPLEAALAIAIYLATAGSFYEDWRGRRRGIDWAAARLALLWPVVVLPALVIGVLWVAVDALRGLVRRGGA